MVLERERGREGERENLTLFPQRRLINLFEIKKLLMPNV
jgi:hypothetical protein